MTNDKNQQSSAGEEGSSTKQEGDDRAKEPLRFLISEEKDLQLPLEEEILPAPNPESLPPSASSGPKDLDKNSEVQLSRGETSSLVPEKLESQKEGESKSEWPLRVPMPKEEVPQSVPEPKQSSSDTTFLPWFTWFFGLLVVTILFLCGIFLWDKLNNLWKHSMVVGIIALVLIGLLALVTSAVVIKEWKALKRVNELEEIRQKAERSLLPSNDVGDLELAREVTSQLIAIYSNREETRQASQQIAERQGDIFTASGLITLAESQLLETLDDRAEKVIRDTALRIATETAFIPWPLADVLLVFLSSMQMFRRIAEIYGSRPGVVASWTLGRKVLSQLAVARALSESSQWINAIVSNSFLKVARRIGEGVTNGVLMGRSGVTAMELCRPLPFNSRQRPSASIFAFIKEAVSRAQEENSHEI